MNQFLDIFSEVMRIATFQWHGEASRSHGYRDDRGIYCHHTSRSDRHPIRRRRP
ncbi:hypothetical protein [Mesorhizobium sp.]|uniref:hypothetical protein n=1 Tax=Mesorhizobium sp. TaxID=1871066 RepID=UPI0025EB9D31|nr:hypothetical protein [Mesorhizobium sp.]